MDEQVIKKLQQLNELLKSGTITQTEFDVAKQRLLNESLDGATNDLNQTTFSKETKDEKEVISENSQEMSLSEDEQVKKQTSKPPYFIILILLGILAFVGIKVFQANGEMSYQEKKYKYQNEGKKIIESYWFRDSLSIMYLDTDGRIFMDNFDSIKMIYDGKDITETSYYLSFDQGVISIIENYQPTLYSSIDYDNGDVYKLGDYAFLYNSYDRDKEFVKHRIYLLSNPGNFIYLPNKSKISYMEDSILYFSTSTKLIWVDLEQYMYDKITKNDLPISRDQVDSLFYITAECEINMKSGALSAKEISFAFSTDKYLSSDLDEKTAYDLIWEEFVKIAGQAIEIRNNKEKERILQNAITIKDLVSNGLLVDKYVGKKQYYRVKFKKIETSKSWRGYKYHVADYPNIWAGGWEVDAYTNDENFAKLDYPCEVIMSAYLRKSEFPLFEDCEVLYVFNNE